MTSLAAPDRDHARVAYDALAEQYDFFTADHDYEDWTATLERLAREHGLRGARLLDVACGTGKSLLPFVARGYRVAGCDVSPAMLDRAAAKVGSDVALHLCDMRALAPLGEFDLVCCLDDALNYLMSVEELVAALSGMRRNLAAGGVLVFDVNTVAAYRRAFASLSVVPSEDRVVVMDGEAPVDFAPGELARATLVLLTREADGTWPRRCSVHHQRHHPQAVVEDALDRAGLACVGRYGMQLDGAITEGFTEAGNSKAVYLARPRAAESEGR
jgi:SAM-dependent methyltransferase